jgi:hypothetical protein
VFFSMATSSLVRDCALNLNAETPPKNSALR